MTDFSFNIDVPVRSHWRNVSLLVTSVQNCFNAMFANVDGSHMIAMVTGELLENAIKYGAWEDKIDPLFRLNVSGHANVARIVVENPSAAEHAAKLIRTLDWIREFPSPDEAYRAKLLEIANSAPAIADVSHLGLVRIAYEAACKIDATFKDGVVHVTGELRV
jgi:hypothetical protein